MTKTLPVADAMVEAFWRASYEAERATMRERGEDDPGPYDELDPLPEDEDGESFSRATAMAHTRAGLIAALAASPLRGTLGEALDELGRALTEIAPLVPSKQNSRFWDALAAVRAALAVRPKGGP